MLGAVKLESIRAFKRTDGEPDAAAANSKAKAHVNAGSVSKGTAYGV